MPNNDREVFDHLTGNQSASRVVNFMTYAFFAYEKRAWIKLYESRNLGSAPQQADIDTWIANLTDSQFASMRTSGEAFFVAAAEAYFE